MFRLLELPPEVVQAVCRSMCGHCSSSSQYFQFAKADLSCLSRTCSILQAYAQPCVYHFPSSLKEDVVPLLRTLVARPDLAAKVQELNLGERWNANTLTPDDAKFFEGLMSKCLGEDGKPVAISPTWCKKSTGLRYDGLFFFESPEIALAALLVMQTPNLETLCLYPGRFWEFPFCQPRSLPHLRELEIEYGNAKYGTDISVLRGIILGAPNLKVFKGHRISGLQKRIFNDSMREVNLEESTLDASSFQELMAGFTNLEKFSYEHSNTIHDAGDATPREVCEAVLLRADTLQYLSLDFEEAMFIGSLGPGDVMHSLKEMKVLKTLIIQGTSIYPDDDSSWERNVGALLTNFLPPSIRSLTIDDPHENIIADILSLARYTNELFPDLEELRLLDMEEDDLADIEAAFIDTKVKVSD